MKHVFLRRDELPREVGGIRGARRGARATAAAEEAGKDRRWLRGRRGIGRVARRGVADARDVELVSAPRGEDGEDAEAGARRTPALLAHSATRAQEQCSNSFAAAFDAL